MSMGQRYSSYGYEDRQSRYERLEVEAGRFEEAEAKRERFQEWKPAGFCENPACGEQIPTLDKYGLLTCPACGTVNKWPVKE